MKDSKEMFKKVGFIGVGLCAVCCLLPIVGVMLGVGSLTFLTGFLEWVGIVAIVAAIILFGIYYFRKRKAPACDIDFDCKGRDVEASS